MHGTVFQVTIFVLFLLVVHICTYQDLNLNFLTDNLANI